MALHTKYRPPTLDFFWGNDSIKQSILSIVQRKEPDKGESFLLTGPSGCGKTTMAYIIKTLFGCSDEDCIYYNAANTRGIDTIRDIDSKVGYAPLNGPVRVFILDECHQITGPAQEALLKNTETPPGHVIFILCTTEPEKLKVTSKRRLHQYHMKGLDRPQIVEFLKGVCVAEGKPDFPIQVLRKISGACWESPGQALKLLDEVIGLADPSQAEMAIDDITVSEVEVKELCKIILDGSIPSSKKWRTLSGLLRGFNGDAEQTRRAILGWLSWKLLEGGQTIAKAQVMACYTDTFMYLGKPGLVLATYLASIVEFPKAKGKTTTPQPASQPPTPPLSAYNDKDIPF